MSKGLRQNNQSTKDQIIAKLHEVYYSIVEPTRLKIERLRSEHLYKNHNEKPLVSICVPTYNRADILIERAVKTALSQSYKNIELIIVGDHCTDNTAELLSKVQDPRLRFYNLPTRHRKYPKNIENHWFVGGAVPTNEAMRLANGTWIARLDDDDTWTDDHIEKLLHFALKGDYEFVSGLYAEERFGVRKVVDGVHALDEYFTRSKKENYKNSPKIGGVSTWLKRTYLRFMEYNIDCWRKDWNRVWDIDLALRIYDSGARIGFCDEVLAYVLPRPGETSVGLEAYKLTEKEKMDHYAFGDQRI
ncbi:glycosyltransferase family 2 protein [Polynucleobacter necessarius]|uniref:glycosyltransferase family 2 protein n=1 Tax=Polynucleobacter necessarius TaxID=576610 RepID=UPI0013B05C53|nr:glycosyltransferase family 2 protein [Polynucleobacter necessarius]